MDDNNLLMIILAFVFGYCLQGMMKNMCGSRLVEGAIFMGGYGDDCNHDWNCAVGRTCKKNPGGVIKYCN